MDPFLKRSNINEDDITSPLEESNTQQSPIQMTVEEIVTALQSKDEERQLSGMQTARKMLMMIGHGVVPICVGFLQKSDKPMLQLEAAWALTNIASGIPEQIRCVTDAVPDLVALLKSDSINLADKAVTALRNIAWLMLNLCDDKNPPNEEIGRLLPVLPDLLSGNDVLQVLAANKNQIQEVVDTAPRHVLLVLNDRRCINEDDITSPLEESNTQQSPIQMTVEEIVTALQSKDEESQFSGWQAARKMLMMIGHGVVPICVGFLQKSDKPMLQLEAAWALTNIASGIPEQIRCVTDAVPHLVALLKSDSINLADKAVTALRNIAGIGAAARDVVIENRAVDGILTLINSETPLSFLRNISRLMLNLCKNKNPPFEEIRRLLPVLSDLLSGNDVQVLAVACCALSKFTANKNQIQAVVDTYAVPRLVALLGNDEPSIIVSALHCVGSIAFGTDSQRDAVIAAGGLSKLATLLSHTKNVIVANAAWTVSNIAFGNEEQKQAVVDTYAVPRLVALLGNDEIGIILIALRCVANIALGTDSQIDAVIAAGGLSKLVTLLSHPKNYIVKEAAYAVGNIIDGNQEHQIQAVIDSGAFQQIRNVLEKGDIESQEEAAWAVKYAITYGSPIQIVELIEKYQILKPFCDLLETENPDTIIAVLKGLKILLANAEKICGLENLCSMVDEVGGVDKLQALEVHEDEEICQKAFEIVRAYFDSDDASSDGDDAENDLAP